VCDGTNLNGKTCKTQGYDYGTLRCRSDCLAFDTTSCGYNSCSDTDGSNYYVQGTVSGTVSGYPFSYSDFCGTSQLLFEYYCSGRNMYTANVTCSWLNSTGCVNGACN
jgi:hypothetical protein